MPRLAKTPRNDSPQTAVTMRPQLNNNRCLRFPQPFLDDAAKIVPGFQRDIPPYRVTMRRVGDKSSFSFLVFINLFWCLLILCRSFYYPATTMDPKPTGARGFKLKATTSFFWPPFFVFDNLSCCARMTGEGSLP